MNSIRRIQSGEESPKGYKEVAYRLDVNHIYLLFGPNAVLKLRKYHVKPDFWLHFKLASPHGKNGTTRPAM